MKKALIAFALACPVISCAQTAKPRIALQQWATGFTNPVCIASAGDSRLFVVNQAGVIKVVADSMQVLPTPFLNITSQVNSSGNEQGLLGLAFDPGYAENGFFYVYYIHGSGSGTSRISRFHVSSDPNVADPASEVVLYTVVQPYTNHNGGCLQFGPDGYLYCGFGDGGSGNDPNNNGQTMSTPLGKMIRIDVSQHNETYAIPADNPFVNTPGALPEIWASGLRNPWRWSFDRLTGDVWIGDVGQNAWEEVDRWPAGNNSGPDFGWRCREGLVPTPGVSQAGCTAEGPFTDPVAVFSHNPQAWCSVIGGYVYRGAAFPHLYGKYIFTDYCKGDFYTFGENYSTDTLLTTGNYGYYTAFGQDAQGELYVTDMSGGRIWKLVDACPSADPVITFDGVSLAGTAANAWQWYRDGAAIPGATGMSYQPQVNGNYLVLATYASGCQLPSNTISVVLTGLGEASAQVPAVYPQPAGNVLNLRLNGAPHHMWTVELIDRAGRAVRSAVWPAAQPELAVDVQGLPAGAYLLRGTEGGMQRWARMVQVAR